MRSPRTNADRRRLRISFCRAPYLELNAGDAHAELGGRSRSGLRLLSWLIVAERRGGGFERLRGGRGRAATLEAIGGGTDGLKGARRDLRRALEGLSPGLGDELFPIERGESDALSLEQFDVDVDVIRLTEAMDAAAHAQVSGEHMRAAETSGAALDELEEAWEGDAVRPWLQPQREALVRFRERLTRIRLDAWTGAVVEGAQSHDPSARATGREAAERLVAAGGIADVAESYLLLSDDADQQRRCLRRLKTEDGVTDEVRTRLDRLAAQQETEWRQPAPGDAPPASGRRLSLTGVAVLTLLFIAVLGVAAWATLLRGDAGSGTTSAHAGTGPGPERPTRDCDSVWDCSATFSYVTFNSLVATAVYGDTRDFLRANHSGNDGTARDPIDDEQKDVIAWLRIENNADTTKLGRSATARDVEVQLRVPQGAATRHVIVASITASNATPRTVTDTLVVRGKEPFTVKAVDQWISRPAENTQESADRTLMSTGLKIGDWPAGSDNSGYVGVQLELSPVFSAVATSTTARGYYPQRDAIACDAGGSCPGPDRPTLNVLRFTGGTLPQGIPDERRFLNGAVDSGEVRALRDPLTVRPGDRIRVEAVVDNGARGSSGAATDVRVWLGMPADGGKTVDLLAAVSARDVDELVVSDSLTIESTDPIFLMYEPGSARLRTGRQRTTLPDAMLGSYASDELERRALVGRGVHVGCDQRDGRWPGAAECAGVVSASFAVRYAPTGAYQNTRDEPTANGGEGILRLDSDDYVVGYAGPGYHYPQISSVADGELVDCKVDDGSTVWLHAQDAGGGYFVANAPPIELHRFRSVRRLSACQR